MLFSSIPFIYYFLPCVLIAYFIVPFKLKNLVLLIFSLVFYSWGEPRYIFLMMFSIAIAFAEGLLIEKADGKKAKWVLAGSCTIHCALLIYYKYAGFFAENLNMLGFNIPLLKVALPIGISFYTFQILSYLVDVYRNDCKAQKNIISFGAYVSMFPQLIAGPIVRYIDIAKQLEHREHTIEKISLGIRRFILGLSKKVILANSLGELCSIFRMSSDGSVLYYWLYALAFVLQIYFDFSGYSDMAIGLGKIFGFDFTENFRYPYMSRSISEFWRRWHISLGSWFRDYIYIPLGGNKVKKGRWLINITIVWFLTGLWHGAAWNFVIWGLMFAVLLLIEKIGFSKVLEKHSIISHVYIIFMVLVSFVVFNATDMKEAVSYLSIMLTGNGLPLTSLEFFYYLKSYGIIIIIAIVGVGPWVSNIVEKLRKNENGRKLLNIAEPIVLIILLLVVSAYLINDSYNPFLYFRF